jgi:pilus assembly protein TadC
MKNYITTLAEVIGAGLIIYGVYTINVSLAFVVAGAFMILGSYLTVR